MRNPRLPNTSRRFFSSWDEYGDRYGVDVIQGAWLLRCRKCMATWELRHNHGKLIQRIHVCPNGCNGKPRRLRGGYPTPLIEYQRAVFARNHAHGTPNPWDEEVARCEDLEVLGHVPKNEWPNHTTAKRAQKVWFTFRTIDVDRVVELNRMFEEAQQHPDPLDYVMRASGELPEVDEDAGSLPAEDGHNASGQD